MGEMYLYEVEKLYHPGKTRWPEGAEYAYRDGGHVLLLFFAGPSEQEIEGVRSGAAEFAAAYEEGLVILLYHIAGVTSAWSDQCFYFWLEPEGRRQLPNPEPGEEERALLSIFLVDANTGILRALRTLTLPPAVTHALHEGIREQARETKPPSPQVTNMLYMKRSQRLYQRFRQSSDLLRVARARGMGGM